MLRDIALEAFEETGEPDSLAAVGALSDPKILSQIAKAATRASVAELALGRVDDARTRGSIARHAVLESIRAAACASLTDREELVAVAMNSAFKDTAVAAVDRLTDRADLEHVAERSNNKNAVKRARAILRDMDEQAAQAAAAPPPAISTRLREAADAVDQARQLEAARLEDERAREADRAGTRRGRGRRPRSRASAPSGWRPSRRRPRSAAAEQSRKEAERRRERLVELVAEIEAAVADEDLRSANRRHVLVQREWRDLTSSMEAPDEALAQRYAAADSRLTSRDHEAKEADRRARREALVHVKQLLDRVEALAAKDDLSSKAAERALRDVRGALGHVPPLPSKQDYDEVDAAAESGAGRAHAEAAGAARRSKAGSAGRTSASRNSCARRWRRSSPKRIPEEIAHRIRDLQQQWRQAADVPRAQSDALWQRFKKAHDEVWARCEAHFAAEAVTRAENLQKKIALCERVEALADSTRWIQTADEIKTLQAEWKTIGPVLARPGKGRLGTLPRRLRSLLLAASRRSRQAEDGLGGEPREEGSALRPGRGARRFDRLGRGRRRDQAAAGGVEDDRPGQEEPVGDDLAAVPRRVRSLLRALRAAPRDRARRTRRRPRGDLRGARGCRLRTRRPPCVRAQSAAPAGGARGTARQGPIAAGALAAGDRRARRRTRSRGGARSTLRRRVRAPARGAARGIRRHRPRSRRESSADGSARRPRREARGVVPRIRRRATTRRCRRPRGSRPCSRKRSPRTPSAARSTRTAACAPRRKMCGRRRPAGRESVPSPKPCGARLADRFQRACRAIAEAGQAVAVGGPGHAGRPVGPAGRAGRAGRPVGQVAAGRTSDRR